MNGRLVVAWLVLGLALGTAAQPSKKLKNSASAYQGCYRVALASWRPRVVDERYATPPATIELTGTRFEGFVKSERFWVKPTLGADKGVFTMSFWHLRPDGHIEITFTTGFVGVTLDLEPKGDALLGTARAGGDVNPGENESVAGARADKVACSVRQ